MGSSHARTATLAALVACSTTGGCYGKLAAKRQRPRVYSSYFDEPEPQPKSTVFDQRLAIRADMLDDLVALECKGDEEDRLVKRCGSIAEELLSPKRQRRFAKKVCGIDLDAPASGTDGSTPEASANDQAMEDCQGRYVAKFFAKLSKRYFAVPGDRLRLECDAEPEMCLDWRELERWMVKEHNARVRERYQRQELELKGVAEQEQEAWVKTQEEKRRREREEQREQIATTLMAIGANMGGRTVCAQRGDYLICNK